MNPQNYIQRFYEAAKAKGFYDETWNITTEKALIITEIAEAINADRKNERADLGLMERCDLEDEILEIKEALGEFERSCNQGGECENGLGLCDGGAIRERQPNLAQMLNWNTNVQPLFVSPTIAKPNVVRCGFRQSLNCQK